MLTPFFGLRVPDEEEAPDGPLLGEELATDVETWLCRDYPCTSSTRPTGRPIGFRIYETDTGLAYRWDGASWQPQGGSSGGGGGSTPGSAVSASFAQTGTAQAISSGVTTVVSFPTEWKADAAVTRSTLGAGHKFTINQSRHWIITATIRFEQDEDGGRILELLTTENDFLAAVSAPPFADAPWTATLAGAKYLDAGTEVYVTARHNAGHAVELEPTAGKYVHIDFVGI